MLLTSLSLKDKAEWPTESIDEIFYIDDRNKVWETDATLKGVSYLARTEVIDRVVALDDFDLELAATIREHLRVPGMGETTTRFFRDKLAMRMKAQEAGLNVPDFVHVLNNDRINSFTERIAPPWVLKPRLMAGAIGIKIVHNTTDLWAHIDALGDERSFYLLERYVPGDIFHVDSIVYQNNLLFACASQYGRPPLDVSHGGGIFTTRLLERGSKIEQDLIAKNERVLQAMGLLRGVSHTEFIRQRDPGGPDDGKLFFLETSARVGGAHIADLVEAGTGINLWAEWAIIEVAGGKAPYHAPAARHDYAGLLVSLAREEWPDTSAFTDPEIVWRMRKKHHVGFIVRSLDLRRIEELLEQFAERVQREHHASAPPRERPTD